MNKITPDLTLYTASFILLFTHEIDSAYWQEWDLFGIPGGVQVFLLLHLPLFLIALVGYRDLILGKRRGYILSLVLAAAGVFAFTIHTWFILQGRPQFTLLVSIILLALILLVSIPQAYFAVRSLRRPFPLSHHASPIT